MCGRFGLEATWRELFEFFDLMRPQNLEEEMPPRYNIAPTQPIVTVGIGADGNREGRLVRWGLVPNWVKDPKEFTLLVNARSETAIDKPSFRTAMRHRRVLIPASGFYEWRKTPEGKVPHRIMPADGQLLVMAGIWEQWTPKAEPDAPTRVSLPERCCAIPAACRPAAADDAPRAIHAPADSSGNSV